MKNEKYIEYTFVFQTLNWAKNPGWGFLTDCAVLPYLISAFCRKKRSLSVKRHDWEVFHKIIHACIRQKGHKIPMPGAADRVTKPITRGFLIQIGSRSPGSQQPWTSSRFQWHCVQRLCCIQWRVRAGLSPASLFNNRIVVTANLSGAIVPRPAKACQAHFIHKNTVFAKVLHLKIREKQQLSRTT